MQFMNFNKIMVEEAGSLNPKRFVAIESSRVIALLQKCKPRILVNQQKTGREY